jgi:uncharacterized protein
MNQKGSVSGRPFDPANAGGPIKNLSATGVKVTQRGIDKVRQHVRRFGDDGSNEYMIERLEQVAAGQIAPTQIDLNYYTHELRERMRYKELGHQTGQPADPYEAYVLWNNAHTATLEEYKVSGPAELYHPEAL